VELNCLPGELGTLRARQTRVARGLAGREPLQFAQPFARLPDVVRRGALEGRDLPVFDLGGSVLLGALGDQRQAQTGQAPEVRRRLGLREKLRICVSRCGRLAGFPVRVAEFKLRAHAVVQRERLGAAGRCEELPGQRVVSRLPGRAGFGQQLRGGSRSGFGRVQPAGAGQEKTGENQQCFRCVEVHGIQSPGIRVAVFNILHALHLFAARAGGRQLGGFGEDAFQLRG
jgi:hypothetical protein